MAFLSDNEQKIISEFIDFVINKLEIKNKPSVCLQNNRTGIKTTALYDYSGDIKIVRVYAKNRALVDILRSIAHEIVHHKQWEEDRLKIKPKDIGGDIEDEANAKAGQYIKMFSKMNPEIYE